MKPRPFKLLRTESPEQAYSALAEHGEDARILAGGQSLIPMMNFRVAAPAVLVDINACAGLGGIERRGEWVHVGALTRHRETERSPIISEAAPLVAMAMRHVAHIAIRNRGTLGGSVAHADPAAELPACALLLEAVMLAGSRRGERRIAASDFFHSAYETALDSDELLLGLEFPVAKPGDLFAFEELSRRHGDFAVAGVAIRANAGEGGLTRVRLVGFGIADRPVALPTAALLAEEGLLDVRRLREALEVDVRPQRDTLHSAEMKALLTAELAGRALRRMAGTAEAH